MSFDASFFVALSFALVILGFLKLGLPGRVASMLDARADKIREELEHGRGGSGTGQWSHSQGRAPWTSCVSCLMRSSAHKGALEKRRRCSDGVSGRWLELTTSPT